MTKTAFRCVQIVLLFYGVFGADEDEVKAVSVMEGDSVTLNPDLIQIKTFNLIEWRFRGPVIAQTVGKNVLYPSYTEIFRDRLQLDQTGSLTIKNIKTKHSGLYELKISHSDGTTDRKFNVTVYESPPVIDAGKAEMKSVSVKEGDRVTLQTGVTQISGDELIVWRFGDEGKVIAKADIEAKSSPLYYDGRFRDRLELERDQTGSLIITDTRSTDSGFYTVKISSRTPTVYKRFSVSVSGVFAGDAVKSVSVTEGESVTLEIDDTTDNEIQWRFGHNILIAQINRESGKKTVNDDALGGRFRDRLELDKTGSLTITDTRTTDSGLYEVIGSSTQTPLNTFNLTVYARLSVPVISRSSQNSSSSEQSCSLLCSAVNVSDVSVSWYRGHSLLSSISASDLSISLSLRLEIECLDDSYSCVLNNSISNQTTHLNTQLCKTCADHFHCCGVTEAVIRLALSALVGVAAVAVLVYDITSRSVQQKREQTSSSSD